MASRKRPAVSPSNDLPNKQAKQCSDDVQQTEAIKDNCGTSGFLSNMKAYILKAGIEKARLNIFTAQIKKNGGIVCENFDPSLQLTHVIVDDQMDTDRMLRLMNISALSDSIRIVKCSWLSSCLRDKKLVPFGDYELKPQVKMLTPKEVDTSTINVSKDSDSSADVLKNCAPIANSGKMSGAIAKTRPAKNVSSDSDSDYSPAEDEYPVHMFEASPTSSSCKAVPVDKWICAQSSKNPTPNCNKDITDKLEEMARAYESTNDKWRAFGYQKAIQALRRHPRRISSWEEAKSLPGVGGRLADKIWEIAESGGLRKLNEFKSSDDVKVLEMFTNVWGAGPHTAKVWYQQGFRTIEDLKECASLTYQQKVGIQLYDDLLDRMPREEAGQIETIVREAAESIQPGIIAQACGSYRRGKPTCGDVDVLVTHPDGKSHKGLFSKLLSKLKDSGFLTHDLVSAEDSGNQKKYLGVCKLPGENTKHRRLDIIVVPYSEYGCAIVYFTGSAHFNRSLRHLCKKQNMSLNEHALKTGVVRKGAVKIYEGTVIPTPTEKSVFEAMNIPYRPPEERDH